MNADSIKKLITTLLVADLFLVLAGFSWFVFSVTGAYLGIPLGYKLWIQLWYPLFQPALGILMLGAIASGIWGWLANKLQANQE